ncbi:hypothetical protein FSP39_017435 [Pinctada imbricata]|uniref:ATP synthase peripheral stalk subunit OSCP, mitochondrial n=1 Tax=Pinctada imbricata TaxID=66713 RepID=A0AA89BVZ6_PINIB|nr:hypothetical protein FSP39_017435 [Pinctada imbricata]
MNEQARLFRHIGLSIERKAPVRQFSTSTVCRKIVQPPIQVYGLEGNYATALYSAASKEKKVDVVEKDLASFRELLKKDVKFADFLLDPTQNKKVKKEMMDKVVKKMNYSSLTANLVDALSENGRINRLDAVVKAFSKIMSAHRGEVLCTVITAQPLDDASSKELEGALKGFLKAGQKLQIEKEVDPSLVGGMIVNIGDKSQGRSFASTMKVLLALFPLLVLAMAAPADVNKRTLVKRAQEVMMFGNQQNRPKIAKKSDPNMLPGSTSEKDKNGLVEVEEAKDLPSSESKEDIKEDSKEKAVETEMGGVGSGETGTIASDDNETVKDKEDVESENNSDDKLDSSDEDMKAIQELEEVGKSQEGDNGLSNSSGQIDVDESETNNKEQDSNNLRNPYKLYQAYEAYQNLLSDTPNYFSYPVSLKDYFGSYLRRRRRAPSKFLLNKASKKIHRSKRDLPYDDEDDDDVYFNPYYFPEAASSYRFEPELIPEEEVEVNPYLLAKEVDTALPTESVNVPLPIPDGYEVQEIIYDGQPGFFIPARDDVNYTPTNKRSPYFFPFSEEPGTHYGAFIPQKREYVDSYERLVRLARALAMRPEGRERMLQSGETGQFICGPMVSLLLFLSDIQNKIISRGLSHHQFYEIDSSDEF